MHHLLLLLLALLPAALLLYLILYMDRNEREPFGLVLKIMGAGALGAIVAAYIEEAMQGLPFTKAEGFWGAFLDSFLSVAPVEELCKLTPVLLFAWRNPNFNEENDGIVYAGASALGFASLENICYVLDGGLVEGVMRAVTSVPLHCFTGVVVGYYVGKAKFAPGRKLPLLLIGFGLAYFTHALYNTLCLSGSYLVLLILPMIGAVFWIGMAVLKTGRVLSLDRSHPDSAITSSQETAQVALSSAPQEAALPQKASTQIWKAVIGRLLLTGCLLFLVLLSIGIAAGEEADILPAIGGGIIIVFLPALAGIALEVSHRRSRLSGGK